MADFGVLRLARRRLNDFCSAHQESLAYFESSGSYRLYPNDPPIVGTKLRHITSTATCIESLSDCPEIDATSQAASFAERALKRKNWTSEGGAQIYCRCRALPLVIANSDSFTKIKPHLIRVLQQLDEPDRFAIGEGDAETTSKESWYPSNAFHTFWALEALRLCERFGAQYDKFAIAWDLERKRNAMVLWAWHVVGCQLGLHAAGSSSRDTDQLAWATIIVTKFPAPSVLSPATLRYRDLVGKSIDTFFLAQDNTGTWAHHAPLFHYQKAGNAYCFAFETLTHLLKNALDPEATLLRALIKPHSDRLLQLVDYAEATRVTLSGRAVGWSSGHRTNMPAPESWATAAVFSCMQAVRRLVGTWAREDALKELRHRRPEHSPSKAKEILLKRGRTWSEQDVGEQLLTMFIHPMEMNGYELGSDPDLKPIHDGQLRSAIMFGPPGTSKTTLARSVADAIGWDFVELHPSHFVAGGLPNVQRTADEIFTQLMELDRCVVLFDEIDELMREREQEPDAFGRFLTTSMLPKLAELWAQRRIVYFVATNHIEHFDQALTRSQRFDALIFVPPPSFGAKSERLIDLLSGLVTDEKPQIFLTEKEVEAELKAIASLEANAENGDLKKKEIAEEHLLAKFILIRWDQLDELANCLVRLGKKAASMRFDADAFRQALAEVADNRLKHYETYFNYLADKRRGSRDFGKEIVWKLDGTKPISGPIAQRIRESKGVTWCVGARDLLQALSDNAVSFPTPGHVRCRTSRTGRKKMQSRKTSGH